MFAQFLNQKKSLILRQCIIVSILLVPFVAQAYYDDHSCHDQSFCCDFDNIGASCSAQPTLEFKAGYFTFSNAKLRKIYHTGGLDLQISGSYPIWNWLQAYGSVEYQEMHGRSINGKEKTTLYKMPLSLGLKAVFPLSSTTQYYVGLGPRYFFLHQHNDSSYVDKKIYRNGLGGFANTGFTFTVCNQMFLDIFGEYSYERVHYHSSKPNVYGRKIQVGGFTVGAGLGYNF